MSICAFFWCVELIGAASRYYALSAASALFKHAEARLNLRFAAASLLIRFGQADGTMMIDPETSRNLEIVSNMANKRSSHSLFGYAYSASGGERMTRIRPARLLNHTYTAMGARLLRANLLAPITSTLEMAIAVYSHPPPSVQFGDQ